MDISYSQCNSLLQLSIEKHPAPGKTLVRQNHHLKFQHLVPPRLLVSGDLRKDSLGFYLSSRMSDR